MIRTEWQGDHGILIITPEGRLEAEDFIRLAREVDPYLAEHGQLRGIVIQAESFPGWQDFAALLSHLRFVKAHHERVRKVAAVTDSGFLSILPHVAKHFVQAEIRHFSFHDKQAALDWIGDDGRA